MDILLWAGCVVLARGDTQILSKRFTEVAGLLD